MRRTLSLLLPFALLLPACGQKGDLYIPDPEREPVLTVPAGELERQITEVEEEDEEEAESDGR